MLEGYCERGELADEGPFGDHTGYYTPAEPFPVLRLTCMTMRRDAIYPSILVGPPPAEDAWLGKATERLFLPALRATLPELVDYDLPVAGAFHNCCIVSIRKAYPGHARKVMHAVWGTGLLSLTKMVIVVDEWVDVHDYGEVAWQVGANTDPGRDVERARGPLDQLDHAPSLQSLGGKLGLDATADLARRGLPARVARGRAHERRGAPPGRRALGLARDRAPVRACRRARGAPGTARMAPLVAVLGASRFLGRLAIPVFAAEGWRVRALDRRQAAIAGMLGVERDWADPARRALAHARDDRLRVRARPQLERVRGRRRRRDRGRAARRRRRARRSASSGSARRSRRPAAIRRASRSCAARRSSGRVRPGWCCWARSATGFP